MSGATKLSPKMIVKTVDPTVNDDIADGCSVGDKWVNTTTDEAYICTDNSSGAAKWEHTTLGEGEAVATHESTYDHSDIHGVDDSTIEVSGGNARMKDGGTTNDKLAHGVAKLNVSKALGLCQSNFWDWAQTTTTDLDFGAATDYQLIISESQNNHLAMEGAVVIGANIKIKDKTKVAGIGFAVLREAAGANEYEIIGVSEEFSGADLADGSKAYYFDNPITGCRSSDSLGIIVKQSGAGDMLWYAVDTETFPINDTATAKMRWKNAAEVNYANFDVGDKYTMDSGGTIFAVMSASPIALQPKVAICGSSVAEGSPVNFGYFYDSTTKDRGGAYLQVCHQLLGNSYINVANGGGSNNMAQVLSGDIPRADDFDPEIIHVQAMHNDIADGHSWATYKANVLALWEDCQTKERVLIIDGPTPWGPAAAGWTAAKRNTLLSFRTSLKTLCEDYHIPNPDPFRVLGDADAAFLTGDWDSDDIHLTVAGSGTAGRAVAEYLKNRL